MASKSMLWVRPRLDYEPLFSILDGLRLNGERRYRIEHCEAESCDAGEGLGQMGMEVEISSPMSHNVDKNRGVRSMKVMHLKNEIAQLELSDLGRKPSVG